MIIKKKNTKKKTYPTFYRAVHVKDPMAVHVKDPMSLPPILICHQGRRKWRKGRGKRKERGYNPPAHAPPPPTSLPGKKEMKRVGEEEGAGV